MKFQSYLRIAAFSVLGMTAHTWAQSDYMPPMSGGANPWPAAIVTAWQVQGEYFGSQVQDPSVHLGAWLASTGGANYGLVVLPGGLMSMPGQPYGGWDNSTRYQGTAGPVTGALSGTTFRVTTSTGGFASDSITGTGESRTMYVHNTNGTSYVLQRVKRHSPTLGLKLSQVSSLPGATGGVSLFDSSTGTADLTKWAASENAPSIKYNLLFRGIKSVQSFGRTFMHIEFLSCFNPTATNQGRANSGIYQQGRYETQVLDSFGQNPGIDQYGSIYSIKAPPFNAELPPQVTYQTYDVYFTPRTSGASGSTTGSAYFTVYANGVKVQDSALATTTTTASYVSLGTNDQPIYLQNHGNEIAFANIWVVPNATPASLPYADILAATGTTAINHSYLITPFSKRYENILGFNGDFSLLGRKVRHNGKTLTIQPTVLYNPQQH